MLAAEIDTKPADPHQVWHAGEFINEREYMALMASPPDDAAVRIDLATAKPAF